MWTRTYWVQFSAIKQNNTEESETCFNVAQITLSRIDTNCYLSSMIPLVEGSFFLSFFLSYIMVLQVRF
jgi:hypothetical protein